MSLPQGPTMVVLMVVLGPVRFARIDIRVQISSLRLGFGKIQSEFALGARILPFSWRIMDGGPV